MVASQDTIFRSTDVRLLRTKDELAVRKQGIWGRVDRIIQQFSGIPVCGRGGQERVLRPLRSNVSLDERVW